MRCWISSWFLKKWRRLRIHITGRSFRAYFSWRFKVYGNSGRKSNRSSRSRWTWIEILHLSSYCRSGIPRTFNRPIIFSENDNRSGKIVFRFSIYWNCYNKTTWNCCHSNSRKGHFQGKVCFLFRFTFPTGAESPRILSCYLQFSRISYNPIEANLSNYGWAGLWKFGEQSIQYVRGNIFLRELDNVKNKSSTIFQWKILEFLFLFSSLERDWQTTRRKRKDGGCLSYICYLKDKWVEKFIYYHTYSTVWVWRERSKFLKANELLKERVYSLISVVSWLVWTVNLDTDVISLIFGEGG